jgi:hypothetical protein
MEKESGLKPEGSSSRAGRKRKPQALKVSVSLDAEEAKNHLHWKEEPDAARELAELIRLAESLIKPRVAYNVAYIEERDEDRVTIEGVTFSSRVLRQNLESMERVFPFVITIGPDLERYAGGCGDPLRQYYLEGLADMALGKIAQHLERHLRARHGVAGLSSMSPGSLEDWPITQQPLLFSLFGGPEKPAGVRLTEHMLMVPRKSISGIYFPTEVSFQSCQLCPRKDCPGRRAPYDSALRKSYRLAEEE